MSETYRGRFAPSPTGELHLGTARTALVAWLRARKAGGEILLRIEDLDGPRVVQGAREHQIEDLAWLGLDFDGEIVEQSTRHSLYQSSVDFLKDEDFVYACTCSRREIGEAASAPHGAEPIYPGTCRLQVSHPDREPSWRFRMDDPLPFKDGFAGPQPGTPGDFVVQRSAAAGGGFAYQLACAVDDADQGITEVVRGADLLASTPRQLALLKALDEKPPRYFHVPLMLGADGDRLAKRHGAIALNAWRQAGWSAEKTLGMLAATLNLVPPGREISAAELVFEFNPNRLPKKPQAFAGPWP